VVRVIPWFS